MDRSVKSATRVFELLEAFERVRRPMRVAELVEVIDAPQSSVSMLLKTLVTAGYVDFSPITREYCPSMRVAYMCDWVTNLPNRPKVISEALQNLASETGESVVMGRIEGVQVQYVAVIHSRQAVRFSPTSGTKRPIHLTAVGIMLLSTLPDEKVVRILRHYNAEHGQHLLPANIQLTLKEVSVARDQGYYQSGGLATPGGGVIAKLLPTKIRGQQLAVGVGAPLDRLQMNKRHYLDKLEATMDLLLAESISNR